jgi:hypothetical protein
MSQEFKNILSGIGNETKRLGTQGAMELASALFNGQAFVPYGPGQQTPSTDLPKELSQTPELAQQQIARGGRNV